MKKAGIIILIASLVGAALMIVVWLLGFLLAIGGGLIHLLLVLALPVGFIGGIVGLVLILLGKKNPENP